MGIRKNSGDFFALDIGTNAIRVVQLKSSIGGGSWDLMHNAYIPFDSNAIKSDTPEGLRRLGEIIMTAIGQSGVKSRDVVIGFPSSKTFTTVIDLPNMPEDEIKNTIKFQIDQYIPMTVADTRYDYAILGPSLRDPNQTEVLISSTASTFTEQKTDFIESMGFNVLAAEPEGIAMLRALLPQGINDARITIDLGEQNTDLAISIGDTPRLVRNIPTGIKTFVKAAVQNLNVQESQARQFIMKFGLAKDKLDGHVLQAMLPSLENFVSEINKSVKFFENRYPNVKINGIILSGYASVVPLLAQYINEKTGINCSIGNPWAGINVPVEVQSQLNQVSHEYAAVIGLAKRIEK